MRNRIYLSSMNAILPAGYICREFFGLSDLAALEQIEKLRYKVWEQEGTPQAQLARLGSDQRWIDKLDKHAYHWLIIENENNTAVASGRLLPCDDFESLPYDDWYTNLSENPAGGVGHLGRDVVIQSHQGKGLGSYLNFIREQKAIHIGLQSLIADIPLHRQEAFTRLGFREIQAPKPGTLLPDIQWSVVLKDIAVQVCA